VRILTALVILLCLALSLPAHAQRPGAKKIKPTPGHAITDVTDPVRAGRKAQRFELRAGDCGGPCTDDREWAMLRLNKTWRYGTAQWIGFSVYVPADFAASPRVNTTVAMIHQQGGPTNRREGRVDLPVVQFNLRGDAFIADVHVLTGNRNDVRDESQEKRLGTVRAMRGKWTDLLIRFDTSGDTQVLEVYLNGQQRLAIADLIALGVNLSNLPVYERQATVENFIAHRPDAYTFNYGLYRAFVSRHGGPMPVQVVYVDEIRLGNRIEAVLVNAQKPVD
jgi:hypothetical protein